MEERKLTSEELLDRKIEFFTKLKKLMSEYAADIMYYDSTYEPFNNCYGVVLDAHLQESWDEPIYLDEIEDKVLSRCIEELKNDKQKGKHKSFRIEVTTGLKQY